MSDAPAPSTEGGKLFELATKVKPPPKLHVFGPTRVIPAADADDGLERHERWCAVCQLVRITVFPPAWSKTPAAWREYREGSTKPSFLSDREPECTGEIVSPPLTDRGCRP